MSVSRQQHEVPRFYLQRFACKHSGRVDAFDISEKRAFADIPLNLSRVRDSYVFTHPDGTKDHSVDQMLWEFENDVTNPCDGGSIYEKVVSGRTLTEDDRAVFADFVASMYARSPSLRRQMAEYYASIFGNANREAALDDAKWAEYVEKLRNTENLDPAIVARVRQMFIDQKYALSIQRERTLITMNGLADFAKVVVAMKWTILRAGRGDFITCDSPLAPLSLRNATRYVDIRERQSLLSFPLTSWACWIGHWNARKPGIARANAQQIYVYNLLRVKNADRQIYAMPYSQNLAALASTRERPNQPIKHESITSSDRPAVKLVRGAKVQ
jgi:hypothetical protein